MVSYYDKFRYLSATIELNGGLYLDVDNRMGAGWVKCKQANGVFCGKRVPCIFKGGSLGQPLGHRCCVEPSARQLRKTN